MSTTTENKQENTTTVFSPQEPVISMWVAYIGPVFAILFGVTGLHYNFATPLSCAAGIVLGFAFTAVVIISNRYRNSKHIFWITITAIMLLLASSVILKYALDTYYHM